MLLRGRRACGLLPVAFFLVLLLELAQFAPAGVLLGFGGIGVFFALQAEI